MKIAEAIIARDWALARHWMMTHLEEASAAGHRRSAMRSDPAKATAPWAG